MNEWKTLASKYKKKCHSNHSKECIQLKKRIHSKISKSIYIFLIFFLVVSNVSIYFYGQSHSKSTLGIHITKDDTIIMVGMPLTETFTFANGRKLQENLTASDMTDIGINEETNFIKEIDMNKNTLWELNGLLFPHDVEQLQNDDVIVADTLHNRFLGLSASKLTCGDLDEAIMWEWNVDDINWTSYNSKWDINHFYQLDDAYAHPNDFDFHNYDTWTGMLISLRDFDLVIEINFTSAVQRKNASADDILWHYGDYHNKTLLYHQHDPEYMMNGNILIADSENHRIIEVNKSTHKIVWEYTNDLGWVREGDELSNGDILIGDDNKVLIIDYETKEIVWKYNNLRLTLIYEIHLIDNYLWISNNDGLLMKVNCDTKTIVWEYGFRAINWAVISNIVGIIGILLTSLSFNVKTKHWFAVISVIILGLSILALTTATIMNAIGVQLHH